MKIGIVSDTHDNIDAFDEIAKIFKSNEVEMIFHCGDWVAPFAVIHLSNAVTKLIPSIKIHGIFGNNDGDIYNTLKVIKEHQLPVTIEKEVYTTIIDNKKIIMYHGTEELIVNALIKSHEYDVVVRGHNHKAEIKTIDNVLVINPGTLSSFFGSNIDHQHTVAIYNTSNNTANLVKLDS
jgi:putative phosphoesterase